MNKLISTTISVFSITALSISIVLYFTQPRIAYIHNSRIISEYNGTIEANQHIEEKKRIWQANLDSLSFNYNLEVQLFEKEFNSLSPSTKEARQEYLKRLKNDLVTYKQALEKKIEEEENIVSSGILKQINSFLLEYGKESSYDIIFGVTESGSIHYGKDVNDITDEVLEVLNNKYSGE